MRSHSVAELPSMIEAGTSDQFYSWPEWRELRKDVIKLDNRECQICRTQGRFRRGRIVHHVKHLTDRPELALSVWDPETGDRQLITVCKRCHDDLHPEIFAEFHPGKPPITAERWD